MPRTNINAVITSRVDGVAPTATAGDVANGNSTANDGRTMLVATNTDTGSHTVTVVITRTVDGVTPAAKVFTIAAGTTEYLGPWPTADYGTTLTYNVDSALVTILPVSLGG